MVTPIVQLLPARVIDSFLGICLKVNTAQIGDCSGQQARQSDDEIREENRKVKSQEKGTHKMSAQDRTQKAEKLPEPDQSADAAAAHHECKFTTVEVVPDGDAYWHWEI